MRTPKQYDGDRRIQRALGNRHAERRRVIVGPAKIGTAVLEDDVTLADSHQLGQRLLPHPQHENSWALMAFEGDAQAGAQLQEDRRFEDALPPLDQQGDGLSYGIFPDEVVQPQWREVGFEEAMVTEPEDDVPRLQTGPLCWAARLRVPEQDALALVFANRETRIRCDRDDLLGQTGVRVEKNQQDPCSYPDQASPEVPREIAPVGCPQMPARDVAILFGVQSIDSHVPSCAFATHLLSGYSSSLLRMYLSSAR